MAKVMLVEDDPTMVDLLKTFLKIEGYEVASLSMDTDILDSIKDENPDVILLDVHLKNLSGVEIDGFDLLEQIRKEDSLREIKTIMSSGMDFRDKSHHWGADGFILKPYMPGELIQLIKRVLAE